MNNNPFNRPLSDKKLRRMMEQFQKEGGALGGMPPGSPLEVPADFIPLGEFVAAYNLAKEWGLSEECEVLRRHLEVRIAQLVSKANEVPRPFEPQEKPKPAG